MDPNPIKTIEKSNEITGLRGLRAITKNRNNIIHFLSLVCEQAFFFSLSYVKPTIYGSEK